MVYVANDICLKNFVHDNQKIALAGEGPNRNRKITASICLYDVLLNIKYSFVAKDRKSLHSLFFQSKTNVVVFKKFIGANFNRFFKKVAVKTKSMAKLLMKLLEP